MDFFFFAVDIKREHEKTVAGNFSAANIIVETPWRDMFWADMHLLQSIIFIVQVQFPEGLFLGNSYALHYLSLVLGQKL